MSWISTIFVIIIIIVMVVAKKSHIKGEIIRVIQVQNKILLVFLLTCQQYNWTINFLTKIPRHYSMFMRVAALRGVGGGWWRVHRLNVRLGLTSEWATSSVMGWYSQSVQIAFEVVSHVLSHCIITSACYSFLRIESSIKKKKGKYYPFLIRVIIRK